MNYEFVCSTKQVKAAEKQIILHSPFSILNLGFGREPVKAVVNPIEQTNNYELCIMNYEFDCSTKQVKAAEKQIILHSPFSILNSGIGRELVEAVVNPIEQTNNYELCIMNYEFVCSTKQVKAHVLLARPLSEVPFY